MNFPSHVLDWVKEWLHEVVKNSDVKEERTRYENSTYGPIGSILNSIFPADRQFKIKPQAALRRHQDPFSESGDQNDEPQLSDDSYTDTVHSRKMGREKHRRFPDFLVAKRGIPEVGNASDDQGKGFNDIILLIIEIKRADEAPKQSAMQIKNYLEACQNKRHISGLEGMLIEGKITRHYQVQYEGEWGNLKVTEAECMDTCSDEVLRVETRWYDT